VDGLIAVVPQVSRISCDLCEAATNGVGAAQISPDISWLRLSNRAQGFDEVRSPATPTLETAPVQATRNRWRFVATGLLGLSLDGAYSWEVYVK
jgi:hypothetical protein